MQIGRLEVERFLNQNPKTSPETRLDFRQWLAGEELREKREDFSSVWRSTSKAACLDRGGGSQTVQLAGYTFCYLGHPPAVDRFADLRGARAAPRYLSDPAIRIVQRLCDGEADSVKTRAGKRTLRVPESLIKRRRVCRPRASSWRAAQPRERNGPPPETGSKEVRNHH
jgi:hypothetical protein